MTPTVVYQTAAVFVTGAVNGNVIASGVIAGIFMLANTVVTYVLTRTRVERRDPARNDDAPRNEAPRRESDSEAKTTD